MSARRRLLNSLVASEFPADVACREALENGADGDLPDLTAGVENLITIYTRRVDHLRRDQVAFLGEDCAERLRSSGHSHVRIGVVLSPEYNFAVFLAPDADQIVSSIAVDASAVGPPLT